MLSVKYTEYNVGNTVYFKEVNVEAENTLKKISETPGKRTLKERKAKVKTRS